MKNEPNLMFVSTVKGINKTTRDDCRNTILSQYLHDNSEDNIDTSPSTHQMPTLAVKCGGRISRFLTFA